MDEKREEINAPSKSVQRRLTVQKDDFFKPVPKKGKKYCLVVIVFDFRVRACLKKHADDLAGINRIRTHRDI